MYQACQKSDGSGFLWVAFETATIRRRPVDYDTALQRAIKQLWRRSIIEILPPAVLTFYERLEVALHEAMRDDPAFCQHPFQSAKKAFDELLPGAPTMTSLRAESSEVLTAVESLPRPRAEQEISKLLEATGPGGLGDRARRLV